MFDHLPGRERGQVRHAQVDTYILRGDGERRELFPLARKHHKPVGSLAFDGDRLDLPCQRAMEPTTKRGLARRHAGGDPLFASKGKQALTRNGVTMVFARFRKRAGISDTAISPQNLRHSFALRYLQAGGNPVGLQALLGYEGMAPVRQYLRWQNQLFHHQTLNQSEET